MARRPTGLAVALAAWLGGGPAAAQVPAEPTGDAEPIGSPTLRLGGFVDDTLHLEHARTDGEVVAVSSARAQLIVDASPVAFADLRATLVGTLPMGAVDIPLTRYLPDDTVAGLQQPDPDAGLPGTAEVLYYRLEPAIWFQEAYAAVHGPWFQVRVGRQRYQMGNGTAFLALDVLNVRDPLDPSYEVDGLDALSLSVRVPGGVEVEGLARLGQHGDLGDYLGRVRFERPQVTVAIQYLHHVRHRVDWQAIDSPEGLEALVGGATVESFTRRFRWHLLGGEVAARLGGLGMHAEIAYALVEPIGEVGTLSRAAEDHERVVVGVDYTFGSGVVLMAEYFRFGQGRSSRSDLDLNDRLALLVGEIQTANRDTGFLGVIVPLGHHVELAPYALVSINDPSVLFNPWLTVELAPVVTLWASGYIPVGPQEGQLGKAGVGGSLKVRIAIPVADAG